MNVDIWPLLDHSISIGNVQKSFKLGLVMKSTLERFSHIAVIIACLAVTAQVGGGIYRGWHLDHDIRPTTTARNGAYSPGSTISDKANLGISKSQKTLILVTNSECRFCSASMRFYRQLTAAARSSSTRVVALTEENLLANRDYLRSNGVTADGYGSIADSGILARATPTLILVQRDGTVLNSWTGQLSEKEEQRVLASLKS
jgi:hypothetical protein